jgi:hypothetical protein
MFRSWAWSFYLILKSKDQLSSKKLKTRDALFIKHASIATLLKCRWPYSSINMHPLLLYQNVDGPIHQLTCIHCYLIKMQIWHLPLESTSNANSTCKSLRWMLENRPCVQILCVRPLVLIEGNKLYITY